MQTFLMANPNPEPDVEGNSRKRSSNLAKLTHYEAVVVSNSRRLSKEFPRIMLMKCLPYVPSLEHNAC